MKTAYIIYYDKEAQKNSGFIEMLMTEFFKYDIVLEYVSYEVTAAMSGDVFKNSFNDAVFVINRTREYRLSKRFEDFVLVSPHIGLQVGMCPHYTFVHYGNDD